MAISKKCFEFYYIRDEGKILLTHTFYMAEILAISSTWTTHSKNRQVLQLDCTRWNLGETWVILERYMPITEKPCSNNLRVISLINKLLALLSITRHRLGCMAPTWTRNPG